MTIGARVLKTGLAVALAIWLSGWFQFPSPIIAAVAAIFTIQPSIYRSWQQVLDQVQSNVLGAIIALAAVNLLGATPITVGIVIVGVILLIIRLKMESAIGLTLVTVVAVMEAHADGWLFAVERFAMVMTGIGSAFFVNVLVYPPRPKKQFVEQVHEAYDKLSLLLRTAISNEMKEQVFQDEKEKLDGMLRKLDERYSLFEEERAFRRERKQERARQLLLSRQMIRALQKGEALLDAVDEHYYSSPGSEAWAEKFDRKIETLTKMHEQLLLKSEGLMKPGAVLAFETEDDTVFASELADYLHEEPSGRRRLIFVASAMYEYAYQLRRLDKVLTQVLERGGQSEEDNEAPERLD